MFECYLQKFSVQNPEPNLMLMCTKSVLVCVGSSIVLLTKNVVVVGSLEEGAGHIGHGLLKENANHVKFRKPTIEDYLQKKKKAYLV